MRTCEKHQMQFKDWCPECSNEARRGSTPTVTDFSTWDRATLEQFARDASGANVDLKEQVATLLDAWRKAVVRNAQA